MSRTNAKDEFVEHTEGKEILCAKIGTGEYEWEDFKTFLLRQGYDSLDYSYFLTQIDYIYDSGYGGQELFGTIWYTDGTWSTRGEYDGSEWWEHNQVPEIPPELLTNNTK